MDNTQSLSYRVQGAIFEVYNNLGPGLLESVYQAALMHELKLRGMKVEEFVKLPVLYKNVEVKEAFVLDIIVENRIIIEIKSVHELDKVQFKQILNYLRLKDLYIGFLVNFNAISLDDQQLIKVFNKHATDKTDY